MSRILPLFALALLAATMLASGAAAKEDVRTAAETLLLQQPTVSKQHVVFVYAQDLWIVGRAGGVARRLTSDVGRESSPRLSPDGRWVAFTGEYGGNADVYLIAVDGGVPRRLTWHPGSDSVRGWHPDGKRVLFASGRASGAPVRRLYHVSVDGGTPVPLAVPRAAHATWNPRGDRLAYTPYGDAFGTWKRYRGGRVPPVWIYDPATHEVEQVPRDSEMGRSTRLQASDTYPCWIDDDLYFASDRPGEDGTVQMNVWRHRPGKGGVPAQVTRFTDFGVQSLSAGAGVLVFSVAGAIRIYDPRDGSFRRLQIRVPTDGLGRLPRWKSVKGFVRAADLAPNGKRAVFEARGEILTVPREHGPARNLTQTPGVHERSPAWSPDGEHIAWFSDEGGEYRLVVRDRLGRKTPKRYDLGGARFYNDPRWSPDGKHILFSDKGNRLAFVTLETGTVTPVATTQGGLGQLQPQGTWSPDSQWIAFEKRNAATTYDSIALFELASGTVTVITDGFSTADSPAFSKDGTLLFLRASVDSGPRRFGLDLSTSAVRRPSGNLYLVVLKKDGKNPLGPRSDEGVDPKDAKKNAKKDAEKKAKEKDAQKEAGEEAGAAKEGEDLKSKPQGEEDTGKTEGPSIDLEGISQRILALPVGSGTYYNLICSKTKLLFIERSEGNGSALKAYDLKGRKVDTLVPGAGGVAVSADGTSLLVMAGRRYTLSGENGKGGKAVHIDDVKVRVDPSREWPQMLRECWRIQRDFFYDPQLHQVDWDSMWERWSAFLPHVQHRQDLNLLMGEMMGELCCGHEYVYGGDMPSAAGGIDVGLLGADFAVEDGHHRIVRIYEGQNWNPGLRAPLTEPGVDVRQGDYLLAVNGRPLRGSDNLFEAFQDTAGEPTEMTVSAAADGSAPRTVTVTPLGDDARLRQKAWIEANRRRVDELSGGRLAYVYMPNTAGAGLAAFDRDFYSQLDKQGLVLDERFNGGGKVADYVVSVLDREVLCYWMNREGWLGRTPFGTLRGPKVMVINERAGSGGDCMPWMFRELGIGPLVGTRTWGGLVGISGYPVLLDGGRCTAASFGIMDTHGRWVVENVGVAPDHEVIQWPKDVIAGRDPQLEKAVALALEMLEKNPPAPRPGYSPPSKR